MTGIKICGITNVDDAQIAVSLGADALGFVFATSPRQVSVDRIRRMRDSLPSSVAIIGVFTNQPIQLLETVASACKLDFLQVHGEITPEHNAKIRERLIPVVEVTTQDPMDRVNTFTQRVVVLDAVHASRDQATSLPFDWRLAKLSAQAKMIMLAGGLNPENVIEALEIVRPYGVDVSSGVEKSPGIKDHDKIELFIRRIRTWDSRTNADISANSADGLFPRR